MNRHLFGGSAATHSLVGTVGSAPSFRSGRCRSRPGYVGFVRLWPPSLGGGVVGGPIQDLPFYASHRAQVPSCRCTPPFLCHPSEFAAVGGQTKVGILSLLVYHIFADLGIPLIVFPPSDHGVRDCLCITAPHRLIYIHACAFLKALFDETNREITDELGLTHGPQDLARKFRERMNNRILTDDRGESRLGFYRGVVRVVQAVSRVYTPLKATHHSRCPRSWNPS
jgi:hypothetical protein